MIKTTLAASAAAITLGLSSPALAQSCATLPYTLTNGSTADASQVMADLNCIFVSPNFSGPVGIRNSTPPALLSIGSDLPGSAEPSNHGLLQISGSAEPALGPNGIELKTSSYQAGFGWLIASIDRGNGNTPLSFFARSNSANWMEFITLSNSGTVGIGTNSPPFTLTVNGAAGGATGWINYSDARLKTKVQTITNGLELVERLRGVRFQWKNEADRTIGKNLKLHPGETHLGFVAQEVQSVLPEAVEAPPGGDANGVYGLKEADLVPVLVEAIKELESQVQTLKSQVSALEAAR